MQALVTHVQNLVTHAAYVKNLQQDRALQQVLEGRWGQVVPKKKERRYLLF